MDPILQTIYDSILDGAQKVTAVKVQEALDNGYSAENIGGPICLRS